MLNTKRVWILVIAVFALVIGRLYVFLSAPTPSYPINGFTDKKEAKNITTNGKREGKWMVYVDSMFHPTVDTSAPYYSLTVYKNGKREGIENEYYKDDKLFMVTNYIRGYPNGVRKIYYKSGMLRTYDSLEFGRPVGITKSFYEDGTLNWERIPNYKKAVDTSENYYRSGRLKSITVHDSTFAVIFHKEFDENGNEIKQ